MTLVGEQPGDQEDKQGAPFVGPAGRVLDDALETAGIDRGAVYVTNAVKHFEWEARGKRRIHKRPNATEIDACSLWLGEEIAHVHPAVVVAMGTTAVRAVLGKTRAIASLRGQVVDSAFGPRWSRRCIPRRSCVCPTGTTGGLRSRAWWPTCGRPAS
jgi:uracil-DNA glycosylase